MVSDYFQSNLLSALSIIIIFSSLRFYWLSLGLGLGCQKQHNEHQTKVNFSFLSQVNESSEVFECQHKQNNPSTCQICKGTGFVQCTNNLIKFFQYLIEFKVGAKSSDSEAKLFKKNKNRSNFCCQDSDNKIELDGQTIRGTTGNCTYKTISKNIEKSDCNMISSMQVRTKVSQPLKASQLNRSSLKSVKRCGQKEVVQELNKMVVIHQNYECDVCKSCPIKGPRYHCRQCGDFDVCEQCYQNYQHIHKMEKIDKCGKGKQLQSIATLMVQSIFSNANGESLSLRPPPSIKLQNNRKPIKNTII